LTILNDLLNAAVSTSSGQMLDLVRKAESILRSERREGGHGGIRIEEGLVHIPPTHRLVVVGDIHGDFSSLANILKESHVVDGMKGRKTRIIFLGDYGDRGDKSAEVYSLLLRLKVMFPLSVILLRGNHEGPRDLQAVPHDLPYQLQIKFDVHGGPIYQELLRIFDLFYSAALIPEKYLFVHGGVPSLANSMDDIARANLTHPATSHLEEILWNDPVENMQGTAMSPRGAGKLFGENVTRRILKLVNATTVIRGHEPCQEGVLTFHDGAILTVFSRKGPPYGNTHGAYIILNANGPPLSADDLSDSACRF